MEKHIFLQKHIVFGFVFGGNPGGLKPCILQCFRMMFRAKKIYFGGPLWPLRTRKRSSGASGNDFRGVVFEPQENPKHPKDGLKMGLVDPVLAPDSTHHTHPFAHTLKRFVNPKFPR